MANVLMNFHHYENDTRHFYKHLFSFKYMLLLLNHHIAHNWLSIIFQIIQSDFVIFFILQLFVLHCIEIYVAFYNYACYFLHLLIKINCVMWYFQQAEKYFIKADSIKDAIDMYNMASKWEEAYRVCANIFYFTFT